MRYPTAISTLLGFEITAVEHGSASITAEVDPDTHGNQQGTVHGGFLVELADAAIGTAHSTIVSDEESFTSIDIHATFLRPVWRDTLTATARPTHSGRTITHYACDIVRGDGKVAVKVISAVMTLRGEQARGR
ncbi:MULTISPECIES: PaaI family thioesterase [unclassified Mycolicibacterium]|uniref:PaaI family thioesterase n=1 Tax=unclassified Mycolicibacterium TaxID=2636767 RepID=UPI002EDB3FBC